MRRYLTIAVCVLLVALCSTAETRVIDVKPMGKASATDYLREQLRGIKGTDSVRIVFGKGDFYMDGNVDIICNAEVSGAGRKATRIFIQNSPNHTDDCFLGFKARRPATTAVRLHDLSMKTEPHDGLWWTEPEMRYAVKICYAHSVTVERVDIEVDNAYIGNLDTRVCSNIVVRDCVLKNFNNCHAGGGLSVRGDTHNVLIEKNEFYKYGNDEMLSIFGYFDETYSYKVSYPDTCYKTNIRVNKNKFFAGGYKGKNPTDTIIDTYFTFLLYKIGDDHVVNIADGFDFTDNEFHIDVPMHNLITVTFDKYTHHRGVRFSGNKVTYTKNAGQADSWYDDFCIRDTSIGSDSIYIHDNTFDVACDWESSWGDNNYSHLSMSGGNVSYYNNKFTDRGTVPAFSNRDYTGCNLVTFREEGGKVTLRNNTVKGLYLLARLSEASQVAPSRLDARDNYFEGNTRIHCGNAARLDLNMVNNTIRCRDGGFLLDTWAQTGTLSLLRNNISCAKPAGPLMVNWSGANPNDMTFERVEVVGNRFTNVDPSQLLNGIRHISHRIVGNNRFY